MRLNEIKKDNEYMLNIQTRHTWKRFFSLLRQSKVPYLLLIIYFIASILAARLGVIFPNYSQKITGGDFSSSVLLTAIGIMACHISFSMFKLLLGIYTNFLISKNIRIAFWNKILKLPIPFYDKTRARELISRISNDVSDVGSFPTGLVSKIATIYFLYLVIKQLYSYNYRLATFAIIWIPILFLNRYIKGKYDFKFNAVNRLKLSKLTQFLSEILKNIHVVKIFGTQEKEKLRGKDKINELFETEFLVESVLRIFTSIGDFINIVANVLMVVYGAYLINRNIITVPIWISFYMYMGNLTLELNTFFEFWAIIKKVQGSVNYVSDIFEHPLENYNGIDIKSADSIQFRNVSFQYDSLNVLNNINIDFSKGQKTAIVGESGSGKSTILSLIERFYTPNNGEIYMNGKNISDYNLKQWRNQFGYVTQDIVIYTGTILDNIKYGIKRDITQEEVDEAAKAANIYEFIISQKDGYNTFVGESGSMLSGGQRQRVAIARMLLKNPLFIILDEATSNLDAESEHIVNTAFNKLSEGRTSIIVAHKMSTIENADKIIVLDKGQVVAIGTHDHLLQSCNYYKNLVEAEFSEFYRGGVELEHTSYNFS